MTGEHTQRDSGIAPNASTHNVEVITDEPGPGNDLAALHAELSRPFVARVANYEKKAADGSAEHPSSQRASSESSGAPRERSSDRRKLVQPSIPGAIPESWEECRRKQEQTGRQPDLIFHDHRIEKIRSYKIMIIDDVAVNALSIRNHLKNQGFHNFAIVNDAGKALQAIRDDHPDVVLLDVWMPEVNGLEILRVMSLDPELQHIPVLIVTADTDPETRRTALELGANDFLAKPVDVHELIPRVRNALLIKLHQDGLLDQKAKLERQVRLRTAELLASRQQLILSLARAAEHRDNETGNHVIRVGRYVGLIAEELGYPPEQVAMLELAAQLHDVGKIGIPDSILFKEGRLEPEEYDLIKGHCALGKKIIEPIPERDWMIMRTHTRIGESILHVRDSPLLILAARIAQTHHERWDGTGYPLGLAGEDIPMEGRMTAVADVYDALSTQRSYKPAFPREKCFRILEDGRGKHFDPTVLDAFFKRSEQIIDVQMALMDLP